jgi:hypothetical protein
MRDWFKAEHGLPFDGVVLYWQNEKAHLPAPAETVGRKKDSL